MSDEDMQRMPYAELWQQELGRPVPQYHPGDPPPTRRRHRPPRPLRVPRDPPAPDPNRDTPRA